MYTAFAFVLAADESGGSSGTDVGGTALHITFAVVVALIVLPLAVAYVRRRRTERDHRRPPDDG